MGKYFRKYSMRNIFVNQQKIGKNKKIHSSYQLEEIKHKKEIKIRQNFRQVLRRLMAKSNINHQKCLITFLNVMASCEDIISTSIMAGIPSIQNMLSHHLINNIEQDQIIENYSTCSITQPIQSSFLRSEPQIPIYFMCLLQKIKKLISCPLSKIQNQYVIKGTWNILVKYWKDNNFTIFTIDENIEWGLLQLLNFNFSTGKKQRFMAQQLLRKTLKHIQCSINSLIPQQSQQNSISCNLDSISQLNEDKMTMNINNQILQNKSYKNIQQKESQISQNKLKYKKLENICSVKYIVQNLKQQ